MNNNQSHESEQEDIDKQDPGPRISEQIHISLNDTDIAIDSERTSRVVNFNDQSLEQFDLRCSYHPEEILSQFDFEQEYEL